MGTSPKSSVSGDTTSSAGLRGSSETPSQLQRVSMTTADSPTKYTQDRNVVSGINVPVVDGLTTANVARRDDAVCVGSVTTRLKCQHVEGGIDNRTSWRSLLALE